MAGLRVTVLPGGFLIPKRERVVLILAYANFSGPIDIGYFRVLGEKRVAGNSAPEKLHSSHNFDTIKPEFIREIPMPIIRPITDLRNHSGEIAELCKRENEPVFITKEWPWRACSNESGTLRRN